MTFPVTNSAHNNNAATPTPRPTRLSPPFTEAGSLIASDRVVLPALVRRGKGLERTEGNMPEFLAGELRTYRLNALHRYLWLAALPVPARSLARQRLLNRTLLATERPDEHLVWYRGRIFLKPLPDYLLCYDFWKEYLCADADLHRSACGLVLSYMWLIAYPADFQVAREASLIPDGLTYASWVRFSHDFLASIDLDTLDQVDRRYQYGELRLSRLNRLVMFVPSPLWSSRTFVDGFMSTSTWYTAFFEKNFGWLLVLFAYGSIVLSALQVGLTSTELAASEGFQDLAYGLTYAALAAVLASTMAVFGVWFVLFWFHLLTTKWFSNRQNLRREKARENARQMKA